MARLDDLREIPAYPLREAAHYLRLPASTLRAWSLGQRYTHRGADAFFQPLIRPAQERPLALSFSNLIEAYVLAAIRRKFRIGLPHVRWALSWIERTLRSPRPLLQQNFAVHGVELFIEHLGSIINVSKQGQVEIPELIRAYLSRIERDESGMPRKLFLFTRADGAPDEPRVIAVTPAVAFGRPVIDGTGIPTRVLAERFLAGDNVASLAADYGASEEQVQEAIRCETEFAQAA